MGRGRAKAKQTKVARELKYSSHETDFAALQRELSGDERSGHLCILPREGGREIWRYVSRLPRREEPHRHGTVVTRNQLSRRVGPPFPRPPPSLCEGVEPWGAAVLRPSRRRWPGS